MKDSRIRLSQTMALTLDFAHRSLQLLCPRKWPAAHAQTRQQVAALCQQAGVAFPPEWQWRIERNTLVLFLPA